MNFFILTASILGIAGFGGMVAIFVKSYIEDDNIEEKKVKVVGRHLADPKVQKTAFKMSVIDGEQKVQFGFHTKQFVSMV